jgi:hypothetical protein
LYFAYEQAVQELLSTEPSHLPEIFTMIGFIIVNTYTSEFQDVASKRISEKILVDKVNRCRDGDYLMYEATSIAAVGLKLSLLCAPGTPPDMPPTTPPPPLL